MSRCGLTGKMSPPKPPSMLPATMRPPMRDGSLEAPTMAIERGRNSARSEGMSKTGLSAAGAGRGAVTALPSSAIRSS